MTVLRHHVGAVLRQIRMRQGRTLRQVSAGARVSLGYISEIERGQKEPSSEMLAALCGALEVPMSRILREVSDRLALEEARASRTPAAVEERRLTLAATESSAAMRDPIPVPVVRRRTGAGGDVVAAA